jgi:adenylosuccinate lyase
MAEKLMIALVDNGMPRDEAHEVLRSASMEAINSGDDLEEICAKSRINIKDFHAARTIRLIQARKSLRI